MVGNDSVRARILQAFVKKSQDDATKAVASLVTKQISSVRATIEEKQKGGSFRNHADMAKVLQEVTEKIKQCELLAQNLQTSGTEKPNRGEGSSSSGSRSTHAKSARQGQERFNKRPTSSAMLLRHTKRALSSVLRRGSVPGGSSRSSCNMSAMTSSTRCSDSTYSSDANSLLSSI
jgi:hypothetical protein